ncbi:MAG: hypothetical protein J3K34DRAFT_25747 [Monoraphidium minutum]|nr:MAG: hypothetical protein J3K34DRAFT_25747 [Monoraphidium minutum]
MRHELVPRPQKAELTSRLAMGPQKATVGDATALWRMARAPPGGRAPAHVCARRAPAPAERRPHGPRAPRRRGARLLYSRVGAELSWEPRLRRLHTSPRLQAPGCKPPSLQTRRARAPRPARRPLRSALRLSAPLQAPRAARRAPRYIRKTPYRRRVAGARSARNSPTPAANPCAPLQPPRAARCAARYSRTLPCSQRALRV